MSSIFWKRYSARQRVQSNESAGRANRMPVLGGSRGGKSALTCVPPLLSPPHPSVTFDSPRLPPTSPSSGELVDNVSSVPLQRCTTCAVSTPGQFVPFIDQSCRWTHTRQDSESEVDFLRSPPCFYFIFIFSSSIPPPAIVTLFLSLFLPAPRFQSTAKSPPSNEPTLFHVTFPCPVWSPSNHGGSTARPRRS